MILILRGHIRNSFETPELRILVHEMHKLDPTLHIYIHTWNVVSNNLSWRPMPLNPTPVTPTLIRTYFGELAKCIQHIMIEDDSNIKLIGNISGNICKTKMPVQGWKNYWYGQYQILKHLQTKHLPKQTIINTRFDVLSNSVSFEKYDILHFIQENKENQFTKNKFMFETKQVGMDNLYLGNLTTMLSLVTMFHYHLDEIQVKYPFITNQEHLSFFMNEDIKSGWNWAFLVVFLFFIGFVVCMVYMYKEELKISRLFIKKNEML
jgi:hypothetical protein